MNTVEFKPGMLCKIGGNGVSFANMYAAPNFDAKHSLLDDLSFVHELDPEEIVITLSMAVGEYDGTPYVLAIGRNSSCGWIWVEKLVPIQ